MARMATQIAPESCLQVDQSGLPDGAPEKAGLTPETARLVNMELCGHGTFRMFDMYAGSPHDSSKYHGIMGDSHDAIHASHDWPTDREIEWAVRWLKGETPSHYVHAH